jgi:hypothetical protein
VTSLEIFDCLVSGLELVNVFRHEFGRVSVVWSLKDHMNDAGILAVFPNSESGAEAEVTSGDAGGPRGYLCNVLVVCFLASVLAVKGAAE